MGVNARDIDMVLQVAPQPVTFWLELGAFEGGSAILTAKQITEYARSQQDPITNGTCVVSVDTFLGDLRVLWEKKPAEKKQWLRPDGTISLYDRFRTNVRRAGQGDVILPLP